MMYKRGVSAIVATVLLIVLTLSLALIIAQVAIPFVRTSLQSSTECVPYKNYFTFDSSFGLNCVDTTGKVAKVSIKSAPDTSDNSKGIKGFQLIFSRDDAGSNELTSIISKATESCNPGGTNMYESACPAFGALAIPQSGETLSYAYHSVSSIRGHISIAPILTSGRTCDESDQIKLSFCSS